MLGFGLAEPEEVCNIGKFLDLYANQQLILFNIDVILCLVGLCRSTPPYSYWAENKSGLVASPIHCHR